MVLLKIIRRLNLYSLELRRKELMEKLSDGCEEYAWELDLIDTLLKLGEEEGEVEYFEENYVAYDPTVHSKLFSENTIRLLEVLSKGVNSVSEVAVKLGRDKANVWKDIMWLRNLGFVVTLREGNRVKPVPLVIEYGLVFD